ncbi:hypothetical protein [Pantoea sp. CTOTU46764]|uniref:hypothetical protein n=1 Tax=Pantoea TaxID=53335 RepID=UPI00289848A4|nr:hypothetical protein [Pantoea sp. CTOTU46764]
MLSIRVLALVMVCLLTGCTQLLWTLNDYQSKGYNREIKIADRVNGIFKYNNISLTVSGGKDKKDFIRLPENGVGFVGEKNIYFVTVNGNELLALDAIIKNIPLKMNDHEEYINISVNSYYDKNVNAAFKQVMNVMTRQSVAELTASQKTLLESNGFKSTNGYYHRLVSIEGIIINRQRLGNSFSDASSLNDSYQVRFYSDYLSSNIDAGKLAFNLAMTPVTLIGDVILSPLYLIYAMQ